MKYLKLFESHKETADKLKEIKDKYNKDRNQIIEQYKNTIDEFLYDISDSYETTCNIIAGDDENSRDGIYPDDKLLEYTILFTCDKYEDVLDRLADIIIRLEDGLDIWGSLFRVEHRPLLGSIETIYTRLFPQDNSVYAFKRAIKRKYPEEPNNVKLKLKVLF